MFVLSTSAVCSPSAKSPATVSDHLDARHAVAAVLDQRGCVRVVEHPEVQLRRVDRVTPSSRSPVLAHTFAGTACSPAAGRCTRRSCRESVPLVRRRPGSAVSRRRNCHRPRTCSPSTASGVGERRARRHDVVDATVARSRVGDHLDRVARIAPRNDRSLAEQCVAGRSERRTDRDRQSKRSDEREAREETSAMCTPPCDVPADPQIAAGRTRLPGSARPKTCNDGDL